MNCHLTSICRAAAMFGALSVTPAMLAHVPGETSQLMKNTNSKPEAPGFVFSELSEDWWQWDISLPIPDNPTQTPSAPCTNGQSGKIWFLYGGPPTVNCTIEFGTFIFLPVVNAECSSVEAPPFHGDTAAQRRACAQAWIDNVANLAASVDGFAIHNFAPLRVRSGDFPFRAPSDNILTGLGSPAVKGRSSADGYYLFLLLPPGNHEIKVAADIRDPFDPNHPVVFPLSTTIHLKVVR